MKLPVTDSIRDYLVLDSNLTFPDSSVQILSTSYHIALAVNFVGNTTDLINNNLSNYVVGGYNENDAEESSG